jgi:hypothetical protein
MTSSQPPDGSSRPVPKRKEPKSKAEKDAAQIDGWLGFDKQSSEDVEKHANGNNAKVNQRGGARGRR